MTDKTMTDETPLKAFDPFAMPAAPQAKGGADALDDARLDAIGARHGFDTASEPSKKSAPKAKRAKPKPKPKPKPPMPEVRRMRTHTPTPKAQFNQRVSVEVANGFYDYQRATGLPMGVVLERAYRALMEAEQGND